MAASMDVLVDDLATLTKLDEQIMVDQLHRRYDDDKIYTYIGDILVAVNPFRQLEIYGPTHQRIYNNSTKLSSAPHIYAVADVAYHNMTKSRHDQCILVSGESGAGKTESAKLIIRQIIELCPSSSAGEDLEKRILQVNPLLEAFGNAQTIMNDNSSRFGKYTEMVFNRDGAVMGAQISEYLLEKSRVTRQQENEQNFHIFYYLFASDKLAHYELTRPEDYPYLSNLDGLDTDGEAELAEVVTALNDVGFIPAEVEHIFTVLAVILHFSQIEFLAKDDFADATVSPDSRPVLETIGRFLRVKADDLARVFTTKKMIVGGEQVIQKYNRDKAYDCRDATAKAMYARMFSWIVGNINQLLEAPDEKKMPKTGPGPSRFTIGILDIFGFEDFAINSFEQVCINLANEQLQHFFNNHVFELELEEYTREGIDGAHINYVDNKPLLDFFLAKPVGLLAILDEESIMPRATDQTFVDKLKKTFANNKAFSCGKSSDPVFTVAHYAGKVTYQGLGFLEKNKDHLAPDVVQLMQDCGMEMLSNMFLAVPDATGSLRPVTNRRDTTNTRNTKLSAATQAQTNKRPVTISTQFSTSLRLLIEKMTACRPHFVRCIKPNTGKSPWNFVDDFVMIQLNYTGMLETTRIRREGYAVRPPFQEFIDRFRILAYRYEQKVEICGATCRHILEVAKIKGWLMGKTKVFLKYYHLEELEELMIVRENNARVLQKYVRGFLARRLLKRMLKQAEVHKEEASNFMTRMHQASAVLFAKIKALYEEDLTRIEELKRQIAEEKRREQQRKLQEQREKQERQRQEAEAQRAELQKEFERLNAEHQALLAQVRNSDRDTAAVAGLETALKSREDDLVKRVETLKSAITQLRVALDSKQQELDQMLEQRDSTVNQITMRAGRTGENARKAVESLQSKLEEQDEALVDTRAELFRLNLQLESQAAVLDMTHQQHQAILLSFNQLLREKAVLVETERADRDRTIRELEAKNKALTNSSAQEQSAMQQQIEQRDRRLLELQQQLADQANASTQQKSDNDKTIAQLKGVVAELEAEVSDVNRKLDLQRNMADASKQEHATAVQELQTMLTNKESTFQEQKLEMERKIKELETQLKSAKQELHDNALEHEEALAQLRQQLRSKEMALQNAQTERESLISELSNKVDRGEAEAAAQMRVQMRATELQLEEAQGEVARLSASLAHQSKLLELNKDEHNSVITELKRMLDAKDDVANTRHTEHEKIRLELENRVRQVRGEMDEKCAEYEDKISNLRQELRQKERRLQTELAEQDAQVTNAEGRTRKLQSELEARDFDIKAKQSQIEDRDGEIAKLQNRLRHQEAAAQEDKTRLEKNVAELQRYLQEHRSESEARTAAEATARAELERQIKGLEAQLQAQTKAAAKAKEDHAKEARDLMRSHEQEIAELEKMLNARSDELTRFKEDKNRMEERTTQLQEQIDSLTQKLKESQEQFAVASKDLQARIEAERLALEDATKAKERLLEDMNAKLSAQSEKVRAQFLKLSKAIRSMAKGRPGSVAPGEGAHVDLKKYMTIILDEEGIPPTVNLGRFTCKGKLSRAQGKSWQERWFVLDLQAKHIAYFVDHRELRISMKGSIALSEITQAKIPPGTSTYDILLCTAKRNYHLRAQDAQTQDCWVAVINNIVGAKGAKGYADVASSNAAVAAAVTE